MDARLERLEELKAAGLERYFARETSLRESGMEGVEEGRPSVEGDEMAVDEDEEVRKRSLRTKADEDRRRDPFSGNLAGSSKDV